MTVIHNLLTRLAAEEGSVGRGSNTVDGTSDGGMGNVGRSVVSVHSNNSSRSDSGVMADNIGGVGDALADLVTLGGDHLLAVLDGGDVHVFGADSPGHTSSEGDDVTEDNDTGNDLTWECELGSSRTA